METVTDVIFSSSKITANCACSLEIKRLLLLERKAMTNDQPRQHIKTQRHYFANNGPSSQSMVFPVVMYGCESWTIKKAAYQRTDAFEQWCWKRLLRILWTARRSNQTILKEVGSEYLLELKYFGHLMQRTDSLENTLMLGKN